MKKSKPAVIPAPFLERRVAVPLPVPLQAPPRVKASIVPVVLTLMLIFLGPLGFWMGYQYGRTIAELQCLEMATGLDRVGPK